MRTIRILYVNGGAMHRGGIESFMMNMYHHLDKIEFHIDFAVSGSEVGEYDEEILENKSRITRLPKRSRHPLKYMIALYKLYKSRDFDVVHAQLDAMNGIVLLVAKICKVPMRISHSHNTAPLTRNKFKRWMQLLSKKLILFSATDLWACSEVAGKWLYGGNTDFKVIHNAIDLGEFEYSQSNDDELRDKLHLHGKFIIGHVGRFDYQKNQEFLLPVLSKIITRKPNAHLVFVGSGENLGKMKILTKKLSLEDHVSFVGNQSDTYKWYSLFDIFVMPSHFEGLSVAAVEAQANGLQCIFSTDVSKEVAISSTCNFIDTGDRKKWISAIDKASANRNINAIHECSDSGYSINNEALRVAGYYKEGVQKF